MKDKTKLAITAAAIIAFLLVFPLFNACSSDKPDDGDFYSVVATYDGEKKVEFTEKVRLYNRTEGALKRIYLRLYPQSYRSDAAVKAEGEIRAYGGIEVKATDFSSSAEFEIEGEDEDLLAVIPPDAVLPGESFSFTVTGTVTLPECDNRLGVTSRGNANLFDAFPVLCGNGDTSAANAYGNPFTLGCADYDLTISVPENYAVISGGEKISSSVSDKTKTVSFKAKNVRSLGLCILKADSVMTAKAGKTTVSCAFSSQSTAKKTLDSAIAAVATFSRLFGDYPFESFCVSGTPGSEPYIGSGVCLVGEDASESLLLDQVIFGAARQWWGESVGFDLNRDAFMSEALGEYSATLFYEKNKDYNVAAADRIKDANTAYSLFVTSLNPSGVKMSRKPNLFPNKTEYLMCTRVKGELWLHSLRKIIGDDAFFGTLKDFYRECSYKIVTSDHFIAATEEASGRKCESYCDGWINGEDKTGVL